MCICARAFNLNNCDKHIVRLTQQRKNVCVSVCVCPQASTPWRQCAQWRPSHVLLRLYSTTAHTTRLVAETHTDTHVFATYRYCGPHQPTEADRHVLGKAGPERVTLSGLLRACAMSNTFAVHL